jgi:hypothetical protein
MVEEMRVEWMEQARTEVHSLAAQSLQTMRELMSPATRSEHVRFEAAKAIGDWLGLNLQPEAAGGDDRTELARLTRLVEERLTEPSRTQLFIGLVQPGGYLPESSVRSEAAQQLAAAYGSISEPSTAVTIVEADES